MFSMRKQNVLAIDRTYIFLTVLRLKISIENCL